jgi:MoaA/NifB/PqqE/SkfB family radical SAM enzyme
MGAKDAEELRAAVALMRELGVVEWDGVRLDPMWRDERLEEGETVKAPTRDEVHMAYWRRVTRSSRSPVPPCSKHCQCGAWRIPA